MNRLVGIARHLQLRILDRLAERGYDNLRPSIGRILTPLLHGPQPLGELARRLAISKQACSQLAAIAEAGGYVARAGAGRGAGARPIELTERGRQVLEGTVQIVEETEAEYASLIGRDPYDAFVRACWDLYLVGEPNRGPVEDRRLMPGPSSSALLPFVAELQAQLIEATEQLGYRGLKLSYANVLPLIGPEGTRSSDLARHQGLSRQAMSQTCRELETRGFLRRERDPNDRRGAILLLTPNGRRLIEDSLAVGRRLESELEATLGAERYARLMASADAIFTALHSDVDHTESFAAVRRRGRALTPPTAVHKRDQELGALALKLRRQLGPEAAARLGEILSRPTRDRDPSGDERTLEGSNE